MTLTDQQKHLCEQVINVFESGTTEGKYGAVSIFDDGPHRERQISYGRSQTTEYGNLEKLLEMYVESDGQFSKQIKPYLPMIGVTPLVDNAVFKKLLVDAGNTDPVMQEVQDRFFDETYFQPALNWLDDNGFVLPLSALVVYDSFIQSGSILMFLRKRFPEMTPARGGDEKRWITQYVDTRHDWLATHSNLILQKTVYRTDCFKFEIARNNWELSRLPIYANDEAVFG